MNYFQELAAKYDAWFHTPHGEYVYRYEREMIVELITNPNGQNILDVGCGTGIYTKEVLSMGAKATGVDISPEMLDIARYKTGEYGDKVSYVQADAAKLPFSDNVFDAVISITAMEFFKEPRACLHEMYRVLRPGGYMVVATLNSLCLWAIERRIKSWYRRTVFTKAKFYSIYDLKSMMRPYPVSRWRGGVFIPPFFPQSIIENPERVERWCQQNIPQFGAFIVARIDKQ